MPQNVQSIEDLISSSQGSDVDEDSAVGQFQKKQQEIKYKEMERVTKQKADDMGLPYVSLFGFPISPEALVLVDEKFAREEKVVCFYYDGENVRLATTNPDNPAVGELLREITKKYFVKGSIFLVSEHGMEYALESYKIIPKIKRVEGGVEITEEDLKRFEASIASYKSLNERVNETNISDVVTLILATALKTRASDVHIEAETEGIAVRLRIDGVLQEAAVINRDKWKKIVSRVKLLAKVKINISDKPQDGRFSIFLTDDKIDVRCSFLPTAKGESVVMRLLRKAAVGLPYNELGIPDYAYETLSREIKKPNGLILTTGPTGSGKTTTLYAILNKLNRGDTKIVTLEDPIEYELKGINQSQVSEKRDYTFAKGLRSLLRQDPDVVMVGEVRDLDTAEMAVQASLTGHLVLTTLHTNDAAGVIPRLIDIGIKPYFLVPAINAVIGQRLVRRLCMHCREVHELSRPEEERVKKILAVVSPKSGIDIPEELPVVYRAGKGCRHCNGIGYKGQIGIYEIFTMTEDIKQLTTDNQPSFKILQQAIENGMVTMLQDGIMKCLNGITSLDEVYRVIGKFDYIDSLYDIVISNTLGHGIELDKDDLAKGEEAARDIENIQKFLDKVPTKKIINIVMAAGIASSAGDVHIEPTEASVKIRFRIDGILHDVAKMSKSHYLPLISEVKILAGFPTNVKKATWDGRFAIFRGSDKLDCRVSIISGGYGETVVIRLLSSQAQALDMKELGMRPYALAPLKKSMASTKGMMITTGPTGSGKTTTLYSILNKLNQSDVKIITIEDPIEYHLEGIMQTQIDTDGGYTFAAALKSLLRQNPNIIMVGEIRDQETAKIAVESSMTGHLVLTTIHANSATGVVPRLSGLGLDRQTLANAIECSIGQRLVRRICPNCRQEADIPPELMMEVKTILDEMKNTKGIGIPGELKFYKGSGCEQCAGIGYKGRMGIYEVIEMTPDMQKLIQTQNVTDYDVEKMAVEGGAVLMMQDGILKALDGETTIDEVFRVAK